MLPMVCVCGLMRSLSEDIIFTNKADMPADVEIVHSDLLSARGVSASGWDVSWEYIMARLKVVRVR